MIAVQRALQNLESMARDLSTVGGEARKVPDLQEKVKMLEAEVKRWKHEAHMAAVRGDSYRNYDRDTLTVRVEVDRMFLHATRNPNDVIVHAFREMEREFGSYLKNAIR